MGEGDEYNFSADAALVLSLCDKNDDAVEDVEEDLVGEPVDETSASFDEVRRQRIVALSSLDKEKRSERADLLRKRIAGNRVTEGSWMGRPGVGKKRKHPGQRPALASKQKLIKSAEEVRSTTQDGQVAGNVHSLRLSRWLVAEDKYERLACECNPRTTAELERDYDRLMRSPEQSTLVVGCIVSVLQKKESKKGSPYTTIYLSDLAARGKRTNMPVHALNKAARRAEALNAGTILAVVNGSISDNTIKGKSGMGLFINVPQQILVLGESKDFGRCLAHNCTTWLDKRTGEKCDFHTQQFFKSATKTTRPALNGFVAPSSRLFDSRKVVDQGRFHDQEQTQNTSETDVKDPPRIPPPADVKSVLKKSKNLHYGNGARFFERLNPTKDLLPQVAIDGIGQDLPEQADEISLYGSSEGE
ncbi:hypothetical protein NDN08_006722 [Rhodosorus marinus]|uniref:Zinc finger Mcm10/DnaG-type domain-containing protein n=1 Tax=Rhodosorus marinus TaxID=101924 RepID=A0AAV8UIF5_9RHOD|nr:hypothetical protein NDN08_006722 [Rhodosorus marinus]